MSGARDGDGDGEWCGGFALNIGSGGALEGLLWPCDCLGKKHK